MDEAILEKLLISLVEQGSQGGWNVRVLVLWDIKRIVDVRAKG